MRGRTSALNIVLTTDERQELESWLRRPSMASGWVRRARLVLMLADGHSISHTARTIAMGRRHVEGWAKRFLAQRIEGLDDKRGRGRKPVFSPGAGHARGEDRLRGSRPAGAVALAVG